MERNILKKIMKDLFLIEQLEVFYQLVLPNTGYFKIASYIVKFAKPSPTFNAIQR